MREFIPSKQSIALSIRRLRRFALGVKKSAQQFTEKTMTKSKTKMTLEQQIKTLGFEDNYIDLDVVKEIKDPKTKGEIEFFQMGKTATNQEVLNEYEKRGLIPDPFVFIKYLKKNPKILDEKKYIGIQLENSIYVAFDGWDGERRVGRGRSDGGWGGGWWFAGRRPRKSSTWKLGHSDTWCFCSWTLG